MEELTGSDRAQEKVRRKSPRCGSVAMSYGAVLLRTWSLADSVFLRSYQVSINLKCASSNAEDWVSVLHKLYLPDRKDMFTGSWAWRNMPILPTLRKLRRRL